jgi:UDP-glucose 6-dehydrogenase
MKIAISETGHVGLSNGVLLSQHNEVAEQDIVLSNVDMLNSNHSRPVVGMCGLIMVAVSDNFRTFSIQGIMKSIKTKGIKAIIDAPTIQEDRFYNSRVVNDLNRFKAQTDVIVANRVIAVLSDVANNVYSRDLFVIES